MIAISYFEGTTRRGLLVWREPEGDFRQAIGGFDPGPEPDAPSGPLTTVVTDDREERVLPGWVHPDGVLPGWGLGTP